jgi:hypothetical protein
MKWPGLLRWPGDSGQLGAEPMRDDLTLFLSNIPFVNNNNNGSDGFDCLRTAVEEHDAPVQLRKSNARV